MARFTTIIQRFADQGEKTGWTYIEIPADIVATLQPLSKKGFRAKGQLDHFKFKGVGIIPMGGGRFIMTLNAALRKGIGKKKGATIEVSMELDKTPFKFNKDFLACLADEPAADTFFKTLTPSHQRYFSKWIDDAKTDATRTKRIAQSINGLAQKWGYGEVLRNNSKKGF